MRQPLWIVTSTLAGVLGLVAIFAFLLQPAIQRFTPLTSYPIGKPKNNGIVPINIKKIYENDLFRTYIPTQRPKIKAKEGTFPPPPEKQQHRPEQKMPQFLPPLPIVLTGIMTFPDEEDNKAIIKNKTTNLETAYAVGDQFADAHIVRIVPHKVLILRPNNQQETLFLRNEDALQEQQRLIIPWQTIASQINSTTYHINQAQLVQAVPNMSVLIDQLALTTAYKDGISIGIKVGNKAQLSATEALGLQPNDVITHINQLPVTHAEERVTVYRTLTEQPTTRITVALKRGEVAHTRTYLLTGEEEADAAVTQEAELEPTAIETTALEQKERLAPIVTKLRNKLKQRMQEQQNKIGKSVDPSQEPDSESSSTYNGDDAS